MPKPARGLAVLFVAVLLLAACTGPALPSAPSPAPPTDSTSGGPAGEAPTPAGSVGEAATPAAAPPEATATPPLPSALIGLETAGRLAVLRSFGLGASYGAAFPPGGETLLVGTSAGLAWFRLADLGHERLDAVGAVFGVAVSPDGALVAHGLAATADGARSAIRRAADGSLVAEVEGLEPLFSPDGAIVATGPPPFGQEPQLTTLWRAADGARIAVVAGGDPSFSPDGRYVATVELLYDQPSITRIFPVTGGDPVLEVAATTPAFSPDGSQVAVSKAGQVAIFSLPDGALRTAIPTGLEPAATFSADGARLLIVVGADLWVWDLAANRELERVTGVNRAGEVFLPGGPVFGPGAATVASFEPQLGDCPPGGVRIVATTSGAVVYEDDETYALDAAPDGARVALRFGTTLRIVEFATGAVSELELPAYSAMAFSPEGATLALAYTGLDEQSRLVGVIELWDITTGELRTTLRTLSEDFVFRLSNLAFSADGSRVSALASYGCAAVGFYKLLSWDAATGALAGAIVDLPSALDEYGGPTDQLAAVFAAAPGGGAAAWVDAAGRLVLRPAEGDDLLLAADAPPVALAFSADGSLLAAADEAGLITVRPLTGGPSYTLGRPGVAVRELTFSPDGSRLLALLEGDAGVVLRTDGTGDPLQLPGVSGSRGASFSADNAVIALSSVSGVALYDGTTGAVIGVVPFGTEQATLGPGRRLLGTLEDGRVLLWGAP